LIALDTSAIAAVLLDEADALAFSGAIGSNDCLISAGTVIECQQMLGGRFGKNGVTLVNIFLKANHISIVPVDIEQVEAAGIARLLYGRATGHPAQLNFGDCFAYALAKTRKAPLLFKGDDFIHTDVIPALTPQQAAV
jgi:ribonuclease VapC